MFRLGSTGHELFLQEIEGTKWQSFWLRSSTLLAGTAPVAPEADGSFAYPFLVRTSEDRYIIVSKDAGLVDQMLERAGVGGHVHAPRVQVDRLARELVFPKTLEGEKIAGRRYTIGSLYAAVEGYARSLRNVIFYGDDLAEAELFRYMLKQSVVTRIGLRDPRIDKDLLNIGSTGSVDFQYRGIAHLNAIDQLTRFMRARGDIEWRQGNTWAPESEQAPA